MRLRGTHRVRSSRPAEPGVLWLIAAERGEGLNLADYGADRYGPSFTIETGYGDEGRLSGSAWRRPCWRLAQQFRCSRNAGDRTRATWCQRPTKHVKSLLQAMVGFDTVNSAISGKPDAERALSVYLDDLAKSMGLDTRRLPVTGEGFNLLVTHQVDGQAPWLLFESHLDTVSVDKMTVDPFAGRIVDGRLYGRGACDTKGTGAAMLCALSRYRKRGGPNNVAILFTLDEEIGKTGVRTFVASQLPGLGWRPAGVIVGEPTRLRAVVAHNGVVRWRIRTEGVAAHSSDPSAVAGPPFA